MARNEVDAWFDRYENPMKSVVARVRELVLGADPRIGECIKWQAPTFTYRGNLASFFPKSKQHASLMFHLGAKIPGRHPRLEGSGGAGRVLKLGSVAEADAAKADLERIVRAWCDWRDAGAAAPGAKATAPRGGGSAGAPRPAKTGPSASAKKASASAGAKRASAPASAKRASASASAKRASAPASAKRASASASAKKASAPRRRAGTRR